MKLCELNHVDVAACSADDLRTRCVADSENLTGPDSPLSPRMAALNPGEPVELLFAVPQHLIGSISDGDAETPNVTEGQETTVPSPHSSPTAPTEALKVVSLASHNQAVRDLEAQLEKVERECIRESLLREVESREQTGVVLELETT